MANERASVSELDSKIENLTAELKDKQARLKLLDEFIPKTNRGIQAKEQGTEMLDSYIRNLAVELESSTMDLAAELEVQAINNIVNGQIQIEHAQAN